MTNAAAKPPHITQMTTRDIIAQVCCVLSWDKRAARAYAQALQDYYKAGAPGMPLGAEDYKSVWRKMSPQEKQRRLNHDR